MSEHPLFVPFEGEHLAGILTLPNNTPRAIVLLLQGYGGIRSHRNRLWTRTARTLAERGVASVRMDYPGRGDSTGDPYAAVESPPVDEAMAMMRIALDVTGIDRFGVVGFCVGARIAWAIAARTESCVSLACIYNGPPNSIMTRPGRTAATRALRFAARRGTRRKPRLRRLLRRLARTERRVPSVQFVPEVAATVRSRDVLFLFPADEGRGERMHTMVSGVVEQLREGRTARTGVRGIPFADTPRFPTSRFVQEPVIEAVADWMEETLPIRFPAGVTPDVLSEPSDAVIRPASGP